MFTQLQVRSAYSLHNGPCRVEDLVARAKALGYTALALTDVDNLYGVHSFLDAAREAGLRPILGAELRLGQGKPGLGQGNLLCLVVDREGWGNLCELVSLLHDPPGDRPELLLEVVRLSTGLVLSSYDPAVLEALAGRVGRLYAGLSPRRLGAIATARRLGLPLLGLGDVSLLGPEDHLVHRVLRALGEGGTLGSLDPGLLDDPASILLGPSEAAAGLSAWPEALAATAEVAELCAFSEVFEGFVFPAAPGEDPARRLRDLAYAGAEARYGELSDSVVERLDYELDIIGRKGFTDYFLVVAQIAGFTARTCGRGSGAASAVAYCLGITNVDPILHRLYFERFLNESRPDPPDIDIDFAWDERDEVIRRAMETFGQDRSARVANHLFFRPRSALREAARAWGMPEGETGACAAALFEGGEAAAAWEAKELWREIIPMARRLEGLPQGLSLHCGGLVISPGPIRRRAPLEWSREAYPLLQWEKDGTEASGLVKIDLLGNRSLAVIRDAVASLLDQGEPDGQLAQEPGWGALVLEDPETVAMLAAGDTMGVFYIESPAMRQLQKKAGVGDYGHIVIHSSIIRPAANKFITQYVERLHGAKWDHLHPRLKNVLDETFGIMVYQEDVSKAAIALAGFDESEADALRKILAKKNKAAKLAEYKEKFFLGCAGLGVDEATAGAVWEMMESFAGYSFCKPHSASYALVSFQSAWLRRHHPAEFMAAVLSNQGGFYTTSAYISEARRMGLEVAGPDVTLSDIKYRGEGGRRLVVGLMAIGGLSAAAMDAIVARRGAPGAGGGAGGLEAYLSSLGSPGLESRDILALVEAGAFDTLAGGLPRPEQARILLCAREAGRSQAAQGLFAAEAPPPRRPGATRPANAHNAPRQAILEAEYRVLGFLRDSHPLELWRRRAEAVQDRTRIADLGSRLGRRATVVCVPVTRKEVMAAGGEDMAFVSLEDETGVTEAVLFPEAYRRYGRILYEVRPLVARGRVADDMGALSFELESLELLGGGALPGKVGPVLSQEGLRVFPHPVGGPEGGAKVGEVHPDSPGGPHVPGGPDRHALGKALPGEKMVPAHHPKA